jgi:serine/threonine-protein kinase RsbW
MDLDNQVLTLSIEDEGVPFNPLEKKDPEVPADLIDVRIGGLGIHIVRKLMDDIRYKRKQGKNKLTMKKSISVF